MSPLSEFLSTFAARLFIAGIILGVISGVWFLFASYACDPHLARWVRFRPANAIRLVVTYPERCLVPYLLQWVAFILCVPLFLHFFQLFTSAWGGNGL